MKGSKLQTLVTKALVTKYGENIYLFKTVVSNRRGVPDLIGVCHGKMFAMEIKGKGDVLSKLQIEHLKQIRHAGGVASEIKTVEEALELLEDIK